ncbi:DUF4169 family protein [Sphingomonas jatrophae]|uniref:DUF4169 domain-containing protein n=1 Tax=Sphingomonas jatrophae TaxID=1166337 RepID=A0A1I6JLM1_9SPHN|nr:DUF4169 family protein [Sphingomonas jatrophae]SFR79873.1 protein of unknown function [Sphingomonas jatrophae]
MAEIINLRTARKAKQRIEAKTVAAENRAKHGRTKAEKAAEAQARDRTEQLLDGAKREE